MAAIPRLRPSQRADRVRCAPRDCDGLRQRAALEKAGYEQFSQVALLVLRDPAGARVVGDLLVEAAVGKVPLFTVTTWERFQRAVG